MNLWCSCLNSACIMKNYKLVIGPREEYNTIILINGNDDKMALNYLFLQLQISASTNTNLRSFFLK